MSVLWSICRMGFEICNVYYGWILFLELLALWL